MDSEQRRLPIFVLAIMIAMLILVIVHRFTYRPMEDGAPHTIGWNVT